MQARLDKNPQAMRTRRETVEHPFGTIKMRMGATHILMKTPSSSAHDAGGCTRFASGEIGKICSQTSLCFVAVSAFSHGQDPFQSWAAGNFWTCRHRLAARTATVIPTGYPSGHSEYCAVG